jgi:hypothetical protein
MPLSSPSKYRNASPLPLTSVAGRVDKENQAFLEGKVDKAVLAPYYGPGGPTTKFLR